MRQPARKRQRGAFAQASVVTGPGALPELRRRAEDHRGHPGAAGCREDPHAPGLGGACSASCASPWPGSASGLTLPNRDRSGDPAPKAAGIGFAIGFAGPTETAWREGISCRRQPRKTMFGGDVNAQQFTAAFKDRLTRVGRRVRGATGKEKWRVKTLSSGRRPRISMPIAPPCRLTPRMSAQGPGLKPGSPGIAHCRPAQKS